MNLPDTKEVMESLVKVYGPFAFGIVSLLVIWFTIITPELSRKQLDFETHKELITRQQQVNTQQEDTARLMKDTAVILERALSKLESLEAK